MNDKFIALTIAFDAFTDSINETPDVLREFANDEFSTACTVFYDAMQAYRERHKIVYGVMEAKK